MLIYEMMDRVIPTEYLTRLVLVAIVPEIDNEVQMQATLLTETCDLVFRRGVGVSTGCGQLALF
jgi:hypothetical protein